MIDDILYHWKMGRHSGFPRCCIVWFLIRWYLRIPRLLGRYPLLNAVWQRTVKKYNKDQGYIHCALCALRGKSVVMHHCYPGCGEPE